MATLIRNSFYEGIKSTLDPTIIPEHAIWRGYNVRSDLSGILRIREGSVNVFPSLGNIPIQGMIYAFDQIVFILNRQVYIYNFETDIVNVIQDVNVTETLEEDVHMIRWTRSGQEVVYIFGGSGIYETDGTTVTAITPYVPQSGEDANMLANATGPQNGKLATLRASLSQRVAVAGFPDSPNTVYFSAPLDITYFPSTQIIQLPDDGGKITGLTNVYNALIIFRDRDIWAFFGTDLTDSSAALVIQDSSIGCIATKTITHVPELGVCFLGRDNIYALQGVSGVENQSKATPIGDDVADFIREAIDQEGTEHATGVYHNREYRVCFPKSSIDHRVFRLSLQNETAWYMDTGPLSNNYVIRDRELYGSYTTIGSIHRITKDTVFDEAVYKSFSYYGNEFNGAMFNESEHRQEYKDLTGIPFSITFRRENLQPGPARIKRIFLYVISLGRKEDQRLSYFGNVFGQNMFNQSQANLINIDTASDQHFDITIYVDGNAIQIDELKIHSGKVKNSIMAHNEPVRIYEARIRPSLKGHFAQLKVESRMSGELIAILGYGIDYQSKGRIRGIREGVSNNKDW